MELLKQPQYAPFPLEDQVVSIWAGTRGKLDDVPVEDVRRFEREFLDFLRHEDAGILDGIRESEDFTDDTVAALESAYDSFLDRFETHEGKLDQGRPRGVRGARGRGHRAGADRQAEARLTHGRIAA